MLLTGVLYSFSSFAKQLILKKFLQHETHMPYCCERWVRQHAFTLLKSTYMALNSAPHRRMSGRLSLARAPLFSCSLFSSSLSSFQSLFLSPSPFRVSSQTPADERTPPGNQHLRNAIWAFQCHKEKTNNAGKTRGINTLPSWCWTNMSRSLQFTNGPATFSAHRCGNSRTNLIAPVAAVVVSGFVCLSCSSLYYCLTDSFLEGCGPLKWQERDGCS